MISLLRKLFGREGSIESGPFIFDFTNIQCWMFVVLILLTIISNQTNADTTRDSIASGSTDYKIKSDLMALVGMKIPPAIPYKKQGKIPGWFSQGSIYIGSSTIKVYGENGYIGNEGGLVLIYLDNDKTRTIVDARVLPLDLLRFNIKDGKRIWHKDAKERFSVESCKKPGSEDAIIGLMRPEHGKEGCLHYSKQVKMAWRVNGSTGKLEEISPKGLSCFFPNGEDECYN